VKGQVRLVRSAQNQRPRPGLRAWRRPSIGSSAQHAERDRKTDTEKAVPELVSRRWFGNVRPAPRQHRPGRRHHHACSWRRTRWPCRCAKRTTEIGRDAKPWGFPAHMIFPVHRRRGAADVGGGRPWWGALLARAVVGGEPASPSASFIPRVRCSERGRMSRSAGRLERSHRSCWAGIVPRDDGVTAQNRSMRLRRVA